MYLCARYECFSFIFIHCCTTFLVSNWRPMFLCVSQALGPPYISQLVLIYVDMLNIYKMYSELISANIASGGPHASKTSTVKVMRSVKKVTLRLIETFVEKSEDAAAIAEQFVPQMLDPILGDYARNIPDAREPEVIPLISAADLSTQLLHCLCVVHRVCHPGLVTVCCHHQQAGTPHGATCPQDL